MRVGTQRLVAQRFDLEKAALTGEPLTVADGVASDWNTGPAPVSVSADGLVAYRRTLGNRRQLMWFDREGKARGTVGDADSANMQWPRVSPDGRRVAVSRTVQGNQDLWLLDGPRMTRFTFNRGADLRPVWSPDGSRIVFGSSRSGGGADLYEKPTNGVGSEKQLVSSALGKFPTNWSSDGRFVLFFAVGRDGTTDTWLMPMTREGADTPSIYIDTPFRASWAVFSPDGRWVAYESNESGRDEIYAQRFVAPGTSGPPPDQLQVSVGGGIYPLWAPSGKEVYYLNPAGAMMATPVAVTGSTLTLGTPVRLFPTRIYGGGVDQGRGREYDVTPDGRFLIDTELDDFSPITLLQRWQADNSRNTQAE